MSARIEDCFGDLHDPRVQGRWIIHYLKSFSFDIFGDVFRAIDAVLCQLLAQI